MASAASSEPADGELIKQCAFSKGEWADEYPVDVGFGNIYELFATPENVDFDSLTARGLLAVALGPLKKRWGWSMSIILVTC